MSHGSTKGHAHVAPWKRAEVTRLAKILSEKPVVGVVKIGGIPGPQMQEMRATLRDHVTMVGAKNRLVRLAIEEASKKRPGLAGLSEKVDGQIAVIATDMNPFKLYKALESGATMAPISGGSVSPMDITVKKGPTPFGPGPIVGEFQKVGIPAKIEGAKVVVSKEVTPVRAGDVVSQELATMLAKLEIKPIQLKIDLQAAYEEGTLFTPDVLAVDEDKVLADLMLAVRTAHELSLMTAFPTKESIDALIARAFKMAAAVAVEAGAEAGDQAAKAYAGILAGLGKKPEDLPDALKERLGEHLEILNQAAAAPAAAETSDAPAEEEEEEEVSEEEAAAGLGALFG